MRHHEIQTMARAMTTHGGSFVQALGHALKLADPLNADILVSAFPALVNSYGPGSQLFAVTESAQESEAGHVPNNAI